MKKIILSLLLPAFALALMTSCEKDDNSNPTFQEATGFVLNIPANATNNTYDLASASSLNLTCTQPDYGGMPIVTNYYVQVSLNSEFSTDSLIELETHYTKANMDVDPMEINNAMIKLYTMANGDVAYPNASRPLYVRLRAIVGEQNIGECYSNIVKLPNVLATYVAPTLTLPTSLYLVGSSIGTSDAYWTTWKAMAPVFGNAGEFYSIIYVPAGGTFKWGEEKNDWRGYTNATFDDQANAGISQTESDNNIQVANAGWYTIYVESKIGTNAVQYTFHVYPAAAYTMGAPTGSWVDGDAACAMTAPTDASSQWISPAFIDGGEMRAYIKVPGIDWWKTEFTLYKGNLFWRTMDIPANWAENVGSDYSVTCGAGQKLYVDFNLNTGEVK